MNKMKKSILTQIFGIIVLFSVGIAACTSAPAATSVAAEPPAAEAPASADGVPSPTVAVIPTNTPLSPTEAPPADTPTEVPPPTATTEPAPEPPTSTPTLIPIPELERTLSLQNPVLQGDDVLALQNQLLALGYAEVGTPDGIFGGMTDTAVKQFQADQGLAADGIVGPQTWEMLFSQEVAMEETPEEGVAVSYFLGMSDPNVELLEERLFELGYPICEIDRDFGAQTAFAVTQFQLTNALDADGVVGPKTWDVLFGDNALPLTLPGKQLSLSAPVSVGQADDIAFDGKDIWVVNNDFGSDNDVLRKLDLSSGTGIARVTIPDLGEIVGPDGKTYPYHLHPYHIFASKDMLWVAGRASGGTETGTPTIVAVKSSGNLLGDPIYVGTYNVDYSAVVDFFAVGNQVWALAYEPEVTLYQLNASSYQSDRRVTVYDTFEATSAAFDGSRLWLAAYRGDEWAIRSVNLDNGVVGQVLGVCGDQLTFDGQWIWVAGDGLAVAVDPETLQVVASATFNGVSVALTSNSKNQIWLLTVHDANYFMQSLKTR
jgi:peptidoglycan hydrolase-like protein with peptidoglycan-binding domain